MRIGCVLSKRPLRGVHMNGYLCNMATTTASCFASFLLFVCVTPATFPDRMTSSIQAMSQELDLTDLSLPPEVITEALFNQVDLIQDQLEQCEEMVRNNLKGDSSQKSVDQDDMSEDRSEEIAQYAVHIFSTETTNSPRNDDDMPEDRSEEITQNIISKETSNLPHRRDGDDMSEDRDEGITQYNISTETSNALHHDVDDTPDDKSEEITQQAVDVSTEIISTPRGDNQVETTQYVGSDDYDDNDDDNDVYYFFDYVDDPENIKKNNYGTKADTTDSDVEETMGRPAEVQIDDGINSHTNGTENNNENDKNGYDDGIGDDAAAEENHQKDTSDDISANDSIENAQYIDNITDPQADTNLNAEQDQQGFNTTGGDSDLDENSGETTPPVFDFHQLSNPAEDNDSATSRSKRSLSLDRVMTGAAEGRVDDMAVESSQLTFGHGTIRRESVEHKETESFFMRQTGESEEEEPLLVKWAEQPVEAKYIPMAQPMRTERLKRTQKDQPIETQPDTVMRQADLPIGKIFNQVDVERNREDENDVTTKESKPSTEKKLDMDTVMNMAVKFIESEKLSGSDLSRHGRLKGLEADRLFLAARNPDGTEGRRTRRSVEEHLNPKRYVPLIGSLVDRLTYLKHSLAVCQMMVSHDQTSTKK